ncbi:MAG: hypothetical protein ABIO55_03725 [Ginsengibacter sp.]
MLIKKYTGARGPESFVWTVWAVMFLIAMACVFIYGRNVPLAEDWHMVAPLTGDEPHLANWLWAQNNEHRIPLPKLVLLGILKITNGDFRAGMVLTVLCMGLLTAYLVKVFYDLRGGKTLYQDAFLPLTLLHLGNWENFFWSWEFTFVLSTILTCILIGMVIKYKSPMQIREAIVASACMLFLPLCGANGLLCLLPVMPLLAFEAYIHFKLKEPGTNRKVGVILITAMALTILIIICYFVGYERPSWYPPSPSIFITLKTSIRFMSLAFGPIAEASWGLSGFFIMLLVISTTCLLFFTLLKSRGTEFRRVLGLLFFLGGNVAFALALGYGRATMFPTLGLPMRYVLLAVPLLIVCYGSWQIYGVPVLTKIIQWGLFFTMLSLLFHNTLKGLAWRKWYLDGADTVLHDIKKGVPHSQLVARHNKFLLHWNQDMLSTGMQQLKKAGMGPLKYMKEDTVIKNIP